MVSHIKNFKYQLSIWLPKKKAVKVPVIKKGPKGTSDFKVFLPDNINPIPIIAPRKKAKNKPTKILGNPKINPIKKASFMSPPPIHLPLEINTIKKKKIAAPLAEYIVFSISYPVYTLKKIPDIKYQIADTTIAG